MTPTILAHGDVVEHSAGITLAIGAVAAYLVGWIHRPERRSIGRASAFSLGIGALVVATTPVVESWADATFTSHMVQHLVIYAAVPPLLVAGRPITTMAVVLPGRVRRPVNLFGRAVAPPLRPLLAFVATIAVLYGLHLSLLYDLALDDTGVHVASHLALLAAGLLSWNVVLRPGVVDGPLRLGFAIATGVPVAILGLALTSASSPLSQRYISALGPSEALADQRAGGALMWIGAMVAGVALTVTSVWRWASHEQAIADRVESTGRRRQMVGMVKVTVVPEPGAESME